MEGSATQGDRQLVRSSQVEGVLLRDTSRLELATFRLTVNLLYLLSVRPHSTQGTTAQAPHELLTWDRSCREVWTRTVAQ